MSRPIFHARGQTALRRAGESTLICALYCCIPHLTSGRYGNAMSSSASHYALTRCRVRPRIVAVTAQQCCCDIILFD